MQGYSGSYDTVKKFVASIREEQPGPTCVRFETEPGEQAQVDWSPAGKPEWEVKKLNFGKTKGDPLRKPIQQLD